MNIDVCAGSCAMCYLIGRYLLVPIPFAVYCLLFMVVFVIYLADHSVDSYNSSKLSLSERRQFYAHNSNYLSAIAVFLGLMGLAIACVYLPITILINGLFFGLMCGTYLIFNLLFNKYTLPKELIIAVLYVVGISFYPLSIYNLPIDNSTFIFMSIILLIAFENLLIYSIIDHDEDTSLGFQSISTRFGIPFCKTLCFCTFILNFVMLVWLWQINPEKWVYLLVLSLIHTAQFFVYIIKEKLTKYALYRWIADGAFMLPWLLIFTT